MMCLYGHITGSAVYVGLWSEPCFETRHRGELEQRLSMTIPHHERCRWGWCSLSSTTDSSEPEQTDTPTDRHRTITSGGPSVRTLQVNQTPGHMQKDAACSQVYPNSCHYHLYHIYIRRHVPRGSKRAGPCASFPALAGGCDPRSPTWPSRCRATPDVNKPAMQGTANSTAQGKGGVGMALLPSE